MNVVGCFPEEYLWLVNRAGCDLTPGFKAMKAVDHKGRIHGMIGFGSWTENSFVMHIALENPACLRSLLKWCFAYPFNQCGRNVALAMVRANNTRSAELCRRVGFREVYRVKDGIAVGEDMILFQMRREECRWISERKAA